MKKILLLMTLFVAAFSATAQDGIRVNYKGAQPTISDFVSAFVSSRDNADEEDCCVDEAFNGVCYVWDRYQKGNPLEEWETLTVDEKNGYVVYEHRSEYESVEDVVRMEMCYWNEADGKHKLFAYNVACFRNGEYNPGQFDGITFYRYNNATKQMTMCEAPGFDVIYGTDDGAWVSYALPRTGKDITVTSWYYNENRHKQQTLKWNGRQFTL